MANQLKEKIIEILTIKYGFHQMNDFVADQILEVIKEKYKTNEKYMREIIKERMIFGKTLAEQEVLEEIRNNPNWKNPLLKSWQEKLKK